MIHFIFSEEDQRYLFLKFDTQEDDLWLASNKDHINLTDYLNLVDPMCYLASYGNREPFTQDFLFSYVQPTGQKIYYCSIGLWQEIYLFFIVRNCARKFKDCMDINKKKRASTWKPSALLNMYLISGVDLTPSR